MDKILDKLSTVGMDLGLKLIGFVLIIIIGFKISSLVIKLINKGLGFNKLEKTVKTFISSFLNVVFKILVLLTGLSYLGVPMTSMITIFGSVSLAIGLALQGGLTNMVGGLLILIFKPYKVDDYIEVDSIGGFVDSINIFYTILRTITNEKIVMPNGNLANTNIKNYTSFPKRRLDLEFSVSYSSDIDKVKDVINNVIKDEELILKDEDIFVRLTKHDDSALIFTTRVWCKKEDYWPLRFNMLENVKKAFDKNNISIPFPQMDVHLDK